MREVVGSGYWRYRDDALLDHAETIALRAAGFQVFSIPAAGVLREQALALVRTHGDRHPEQGWLQAMLPGFTDAHDDRDHRA